MLFALILFFGSLYSNIAKIVVETECGLLSTNNANKTRNGTPFIAFLGVPYAAPPLNELRFEPPQPYPKWEGIRSANEFGAICTQSETGPVMGQEDCLFLNIFTPNISPNRLMPVLVFIHGGAFVTGNSNSFPFNNFVDFKVVAVSCNYRLGVFGFLSSGDELIPGNYALKDQLAVLKWVKRNIRAFGGDPNSVTLMGQSSGSQNAHMHMFSAESAGKDLFHRAILMSGSALALWSYYPGEYAKSTYQDLLKETNCNRGSKQDNVRCLKKYDYKKLKEIDFLYVANSTNPYRFRPVRELPSVKKAFLIKDPRELQYNNPNIPILLGRCSEEGIYNAIIFYEFHDEQNYYESLQSELPISLSYKYWTSDEDESNRVTEILLDHYFPLGGKLITRGTYSTAGIISVFGNLIFRMPIVETSISYPGRTYQYEFDYTTAKSTVNLPEYEKFGGASHTDDIFNLLSTKTNGTDLLVAEQMMKYFTNFIKTGDPNEGNSLPLWTPVMTEEVEYLHMNGEAFEMKTGMACDENYSLYKSLPLNWKAIPDENYSLYKSLPLNWKAIPSGQPRCVLFSWWLFVMGIGILRNTYCLVKDF